MDDISSAIKHSQRLERVLKEHHHASGHDLHELISSCQDRLPSDVLNKLRFIATIRNKMEHNDAFYFDEMNAFQAACRHCEKELQPRGNRMVWRLTFFLIFAATAGSVWFYVEHWQFIIPN